MRKMITLLFIVLSLFCMNLTSIFANEGDELPEGCVIVQNEDGTVSLLCDEEQDENVSLCGGVCILDCWGDPD